MESLILHPTATAQWQALVEEAEQASSIYLSEELESYLVFLLMRFAENPMVAQSIMATDFLESFHQLKLLKQEGLRDVGDKCLLFSGLFPGTACRRRVRISYYVKLGQTAYLSLSTSYFNKLSELFASLGDQFVGLMDILQTMRDITKNKTDGFIIPNYPSNSNLLQ